MAEGVAVTDLIAAGLVEVIEGADPKAKMPSGAPILCRH